MRDDEGCIGEPLARCGLRGLARIQNGVTTPARAFRWDQEAAAMRKRRGPSDSIRETVPRETLRSRRDYKRRETVDSADGDTNAFHPSNCPSHLAAHWRSIGQTASGRASSCGQQATATRKRHAPS
jgi:hypothetical protein